MYKCGICGCESLDHVCVAVLAARIAKLEAAAKVPDPAQCKCSPAPEFKLGQETRLVIDHANTDGMGWRLGVARETSRLIAEWLRRTSWDTSTVISRIERGEWGAQ